MVDGCDVAAEHLHVESVVTIIVGDVNLFAFACGDRPREHLGEVAVGRAEEYLSGRVTFAYQVAVAVSNLLVCTHDQIDEPVTVDVAERRLPVSARDCGAVEGVTLTENGIAVVVVQWGIIGRVIGAREDIK